MQQHKSRIPVQYIVLDTLGSVLVGLGIYSLIVEEVPSALVSLNLKRDAWRFIIGGLILMPPIIIYIFRRRFKS
jgi:ABC-type tungstate transport system substrate-binding protein